MTQALNLALFANKLNTSGATDNTGLQNSSVTVAAGTGMSGGGAVALGSSVTLTNTGVTSLVAGTGISVSGGTGAVTVNSTASIYNLKRDLFTSGSGNWTCPTGVNLVKVSVIGGGGGSSFATCFGEFGLGGRSVGASGYVVVTAGTNYSYAVGAAGSGLTYSGCGAASSGSGGTSSFGGVLASTGGSGINGNTGGAPGGVGNQGVPSGSAFTFMTTFRSQFNTPDFIVSQTGSLGGFGGGGATAGASGVAGAVLIEYVG